MKIKDSDLKIQRITRSGPGGQHRNRKATGIRLTHLPTGILCMSTTERSQKQNIEKALERLKQKLQKKFQKKKKRIRTQANKASKKRMKKKKEMRSEIKKQRKKINY